MACHILNECSRGCGKTLPNRDVRRYRVAVFLNDAVSGATLGYYGTLLAVCSRRRRSFSVHVPALGGVIEVPQADLLVVGQDGLHPMSAEESAWYLAERRWEVQFDSPIAEDNAELRGTYRVGSREHGKFHFEKRNQPGPTYEFAIPAQASPASGRLLYYVPADRVLNREAVMLALAEVLDVDPEDDGEGPPVATDAPADLLP